MSDSQLRDASAASIAVLTEKELAQRRREDGARVVSHAGHYWEQVGAPGFFEPVHLLARLSAAEATRPTPFCWGFRAALTPEDSGAANGTVPIERLSSFESYDLDSLSLGRRNQIKKCQRRVRIVQLTEPSLLLEQGYETVVDALSRTRHKKPPPREKYLTEVRKYFRGNHWCVLAGLIGDKLGGYLDGYAVDGVAYGINAYYATWALPTNISIGLIFELVQVFRRNRSVRAYISGLHAREDSQLSQYKSSLGFVVEHIPIKWDMNPLARAFVRWRRPHAYYRLTGEAAKSQG